MTRGARRCFCAALVALACGSAAAGTQGQAAGPGPRAAAGRAAAAVQQQHAEIVRLRGEVAAGEARRLEAAQRLEAQDRMIRNLREELRAAGNGAKAGSR